jgi:clan AA aspartic protease
MDGSMIRGTINASLDAVVRLSICGPAGRTRRIRAVIDTGFNGTLTLPPSLIADLGLPWHRRGIAELGDGSESVFDVYRCVIIWNRRRREIRVDGANTTPLIGMELLLEHEVKLAVRQRGAVTIKPLRSRRSR